MNKILMLQFQKIKYTFFGFIIILNLLAFSSCKKNTVDPINTDNKITLLTKNSWVLEKFTDINNNVIADGKLSTNVNLIKLLEYEFRSNKQVLAKEITTKQVINAGVWDLINSDGYILIDVAGLKDEFKLVEITKNKLVLRPNEKVFTIVDKTTVVNMEFKPNI